MGKATIPQQVCLIREWVSCRWAQGPHSHIFGLKGSVGSSKFVGPFYVTNPFSGWGQIISTGDPPEIRKGILGIPFTKYGAISSQWCYTNFFVYTAMASKLMWHPWLLGRCQYSSLPWQIMTDSMLTYVEVAEIYSAVRNYIFSPFWFFFCIFVTFKWVRQLNNFNITQQWQSKYEMQFLYYICIY